METFLKDFGMHVTKGKTASGQAALYSRGTDGNPFLHEVVQADKARFVGMGVVMNSAEELDALASLDGGSAEQGFTPAASTQDCREKLQLESGSVHFRYVR